MSLRDKVMFWKKEPEIGKFDMERFKAAEAQMPAEDKFTGLPSEPNFGRTDFGFRPEEVNPTPSGFQTPPSQVAMQPMDTHHQEIVSKNIEVLSSKIDALRSTLESINIRLQNIERIAMQSEEDVRQRRW